MRSRATRRAARSIASERRGAAAAQGTELLGSHEAARVRRDGGEPRAVTRGEDDRPLLLPVLLHTPLLRSPERHSHRHRDPRTWGSSANHGQERALRLPVSALRARRLREGESGAIGLERLQCHALPAGWPRGDEARSPLWRTTTMQMMFLVALLPFFGAQNGREALSQSARERAAPVAAESWDDLSRRRTGRRVDRLGRGMGTAVPEGTRARSPDPLRRVPSGHATRRQAAGGESSRGPLAPAQCRRRLRRKAPTRATSTCKACSRGCKPPDRRRGVADARSPLVVLARAELDGRPSEAMLGTLALDETSPAVHRAALLGLAAEIVAGHDAEEAFALRIECVRAPG